MLSNPTNPHARVTVYSTDACAFCTASKRLLEARGVPFQEIHLGRDSQGRHRLQQQTGASSFPQIEIDGECIGGWQQLQALERSGELLRRLGLDA